MIYRGKRGERGREGWGGRTDARAKILDLLPERLAHAALRASGSSTLHYTTRHDATPRATIVCHEIRHPIICHSIA